MGQSESTTGKQIRLRNRLVPPVLANLEYRRLWFTGFFYYQAYWMEIVVTGWVVLELTGSATSVGLVAFFRTVPMLLLGVILGSLADRFSRIAALAVIQAVSLLAAVGFALMFITGIERFWLICVLTAVIGCAWAADFTTRRAMISELNTPDSTANAMSLEALTMQGGKVAAPIAGGFLLALGGEAIAYLGLVGLFLGSAISLMRFNASFSGPSIVVHSTVSLIDLIRAGWQTAIGIPVIRMVLMVTVVMNLLVFPYMQMISLVAGEILDVGPSRMGLLAGALGAGSAVVAGYLTYRSRPGAVAHLFVGGAISGALLLVLLAISTNYYLSVTLQFLIGACFGAFGSMQPVLIVRAVQPEMRARAMGLLAMAIGTVPLGLLITGALSSQVGTSWAIGGMAMTATVALCGIVVRHNRLLRTTPALVPHPNVAD